MKPLLSLALAALPLSAGTIWYNGDPRNSSGLSSERNGLVNQSIVYDDFVVGPGGAAVTGLFGRFISNSGSLSSAKWEIRSGVSVGNGGTLVASGSSNTATWTLDGFDNSLGETGYLLQISGANVNLAAGIYWLGIRAVQSGNALARLQVSSGGNAIGAPPGNNGMAYFDSNFFGLSFVDTIVRTGIQTDFSLGVVAADSQVPEPAAFGLVGVGLAALVLRRRTG